MSVQMEPPEIDREGSLAREATPEPLNLRRRAVRGGAVLAGSRVVVQVFSSCVTILVARYLRPYDYGVLTSGSLFLGLADILAEAGVGKALVQRHQLRAEDLAEGFTLSLLLSVILYAGFWGLAGPIATFWRCPDLVAYVRVAGLSLFLIPFRAVPFAVLERELRMERLSAIYVASAVVQASLVLTLAILGLGFWSLVAGTFAARLLEIAALAWQTSWTPRLRRPGKSTENLIGFGLTWVGATLLWHLYSNADFAILGRLRGPVVLGYYSIAFTLITVPVSKLTATCNQIVYPIFCRLQREPERLRNWFLRLTVLLGFLGFPIMIGMALVAHDGITTVLGAKWKPAVLPFQVLCGAGTIMIISIALPPMFNALGRPDINFKYALSCTLLLPLGFYLMGTRYGANGIAWTWSLLYPVIIGALVTLSRPITGLSVSMLLAVQKSALIALLIMVLAVLATQSLLAQTHWVPVRLILSIAAGVVSYAGAIWGFAQKTVIVDLRTLWHELKNA
jgi:O-antigen/teichoic acid export membrane protein